jgi:hypothetical protein
MGGNIKQTSQWCPFNVLMIAVNFEKVSGLFITYSRVEGKCSEGLFWDNRKYGTKS